MSCEWCGQEEPTVKHHFPLQKQAGGTETVAVCPNCHQKAHLGALIFAADAQDEDDFNQLIEKRKLELIQEEFPLLYAIGEFSDPFCRTMVVTPSWMWKRNASPSE